MIGGPGLQRVGVKKGGKNQDEEMKLYKERS